MPALPQPQVSTKLHLAPGDGEMEALIGAFDWSKTAIGPPEGWSAALRTMVRILLANRFPMLLWWGPEYISIYNDAYRPILGRKHPWGLGKPVRQCWSEIWDVLQPLIDTPFKGGPATWVDDIELQINRAGFTEETHFTIAYSPVPDETADGGIGGVLATVHEITEKVLGERRTTILRELGTSVADTKTAEEACSTAARTLAKHFKDVPFALLYLTGADGRWARLAASCGIERLTDLAPEAIDLDASTENVPWPLHRVRRTQEMAVIESLGSMRMKLPRGAWPEPPHTAVVMPFRSNLQRVAGFLIAGLSSHLRFDNAYRSFLDIATSQIATAISNARAYEEEKHRAEALAEIDRAKTAFFSNVSHEFRTPLTLMLGPLENVLAKSGRLPPEELEQVTTAHRNSLRLLKLVNSLLDFSRIEAGRVKASYAPLDLATVTADLASNFSSAMAAADLAFEVDCRPLPQPVYVDREMWEKIVLNLLSNAFKFTFQGVVTVRVKPEDDCAVLMVSDTGIGIPETELTHIFERFYRVQDAKGRTYEGTGIGLALIQDLVKLHGGLIGVESRVGEGSTFTVRIPFGTSHLPQEQVALKAEDGSKPVRAEIYTGEAMIWATQGQIIHTPEDSRRSTTQTKPEQRSRILLADDNADMREHVSRILGSEYEIIPAGDGVTALKQAQDQSPDLILSDIMMPHLDGFGLLDRLRADPRTREIPVILLSARAGEEARTEGIRAGADDYLTKPFTAKELAARVATTLRLQRLRRETGAEFEALLNRAPLGVYMVDDDFRIRRVNPTALPVFGEIENLIGRDFDEVIRILWPPEYAEEIVRRFRHTLETGEPYVAPEWTEQRLDRGVKEYYEWRIDRIPLPEGRFGVVCYFRDISAQVMTRERIARSEQELRHANQNLEQFAYSVSHDLREPVRSIHIYSELLAMRCRGKLDEEATRCLDYLQSGAGRLESLVQDLLAYTQASLIEMTEEHVDANQCLAAALANLAAAIGESGAQIETAPLPPVPVSATHLEQLFQNLIGNAIKYCRSDTAPAISIAAERQKEGWLLSVRDNGIGIAREHQDQVFGLFKRLHSRKEYSGSGLGLAICRRIVERYDGRIWVESEPGQGSTFYFTLPA